MKKDWKRIGQDAESMVFYSYRYGEPIKNMNTSILNIESLNNGSIKDLLAKAEGDILRIVLGDQYISYCYSVDGEKLDLRSWGMNIWFA